VCCCHGNAVKVFWALWGNIYESVFTTSDFRVIIEGQFCSKPIPVAARSKVCGCLVAGIADSNPARGMDVCLLCLYVVLFCVGRGLCDGLITRPEESYRVSVCDQEIPKREAKGPSWTISACE
jgi:hypothetical protein